MTQGVQTTEVFSIGHSNVALDELVSRLRLHAVQILADVRSAPYSRFVPQFNREVLESVVPRSGMQYMFMGARLGGRPPDLSGDQPAAPDYEKMAESEEFRAGLADLVALAGRNKVCILCSEEDPGRCHRGLLVGRVLVEEGVAVRHIRGDGSLESQEHMVLRISQGQLNLFPIDASTR